MNTIRFSSLSVIYLFVILLFFSGLTGCKKEEKNWKGYFPGLEVNTSTLGILQENGGSASFTTKLNDMPKGDVVVDATSGDPARLLFSVDGCATTLDLVRLTFSDGNWDAPLPITVCAINNNSEEGSQRVAVQVAVQEAGTTNTDFLALQPITTYVNILDDDTASIAVDTTNVVPFSELGGKTDFTVAISTKPVGDAVIRYTSPDTTEVLVSSDNCLTKAASASVTFSPADWAPKTFSACASGEDGVFDGNQTIVLTAEMDAASTDPFYKAITTINTVSVVAEDRTKVYVAATGGNDANDGLHPTRALATIQEGITKASGYKTTHSLPAIDVAVAAGTYTVLSDVNRITMVEGVSLYGGFSTADWTVRNPTVHVSTITDGSGTPPGNGGPIIFDAAVTRATELDGFTINGPSGADIAVVNLSSGSPTIRGNVIVGGTPTKASANSFSRGILGGSSSPLIENNTITAATGNSNGLGSAEAILIASGQPIVRNNILHLPAGTGYTSGLGVYSYGAGNQPTVTGNTIDGVGPTTVDGIKVGDATSATIRANTINFTNTTGNANGISVLNAGASPILAENNTITLDAASSGNMTPFSSTLGASLTARNNTIITKGTAANSYEFWHLGSGTLVAEDNSITSQVATTADYVGFRIGDDGSGVSAAHSILRNTINRTGNTGNSQFGSHVFTAGVFATFDGNSFTLPGPNTSNNAGVFVDTSAGVDFLNNTITVGSTLSASSIYGINSTGHGASSTFSGNTITLGSTGAAHNAGINITNVGVAAVSTTVENNTVTTGDTSGTGTWDTAPISVGANAGAVTIRGNTVTAGNANSSLGRSLGIQANNNTNTTLIENNIATAGNSAGDHSDGITANNAAGSLTINGNLAYAANGTTTVGIFVPSAVNLSMYNNRVAAGTGTINSFGIAVDGATGTANRIGNNLVYGGNSDPSYGLSLGGGGAFSNLTVANNTLHAGAGLSGSAFWMAAGTVTNTYLLNNIFYTAGAICSRIPTVTSSVPSFHGYNNFTGCTTTDDFIGVGTAPVHGDVVLANINGLDNDITTMADNDWRISVGDTSGAKTSGLDLTSGYPGFTLDMDGVTRDVLDGGWSIGAYEY